MFYLPFINPSEGDFLAFDFPEIQSKNDCLARVCDYLVDNYISEEAIIPSSLRNEIGDSIEGAQTHANLSTLNLVPVFMLRSQQFSVSLRF